MKNITSRDFELIKRSNRHEVRDEIITSILNMDIGECRIVDKKEWEKRNTKRKFQISVHSFARSESVGTDKIKKFRCKTLNDGSGYAVMRVV